MSKVDHLFAVLVSSCFDHMHIFIGQEMADKLQMQYVECSALSQKGLKRVFDSVIRFALIYRKMLQNENGGCVIF